jgi:Zn-finger nucleic acid-binding protein
VRHCPVCAQVLTLEHYEGFKVWACARCGGHLVPAARLKAIKRRDGASRDALKEEARAKFTESTAARLRCPRCRVLMRKQQAPVPVVRVQTDVCLSCGLIWLDGGELALVQLAYQVTDGFADRQEIMRRARELDASPERKAQFEEDLARLPDAPSPLETDLPSSAGGTLLLDVIFDALRFLLRRR